MIARAKVICTSRISSIYNTHGRTGSDWGRTGGRTRDRPRGSDWRIELGEADRGSDRGSDWGSNWRSDWGRTGEGRTGGQMGGLDWGSDWGLDWGDRTREVGLGVGLGGRTGEVGLGSDEVAGKKISQVSL